jgi:hypothetical protein
MNGAADGDQLGFSAAGLGDLDGDGKADFIIGARLADPGGMVDFGSVLVYSGSTGSLLYQKDGPSMNDFFGYSVAGAGDVEKDGKTDFMVGAPPAGVGAGSVFIYSGTTGFLLFHIDGNAEYNFFSRAIAGAGDVNGDGGSISLSARRLQTLGSKLMPARFL